MFIRPEQRPNAAILALRRGVQIAVTPTKLKTSLKFNDTNQTSSVFLHEQEVHSTEGTPPFLTSLYIDLFQLQGLCIFKNPGKSGDTRQQRKETMQEYSQEELQKNFSTFLELARVYHRSTSHSPNDELHWKDRLVALIPKADFEMYDRAVIHFTGGSLEDISDEETIFENMILVKTDGYWECIGS